jgi:hypothetical protein
MKDGQVSALDVLRAHPHSAALCERVADVCLAAAERRAPEVLSGPAVADAPTSAVIANHEAATSLGNPIEILDRGATTELEWNLLSAAVALHVARSLGGGETAATEKLLNQCTWLAVTTHCNPWLFLEACLLPSQLPLWQAVDTHFGEQSHAAQVVLATSLISARSTDAIQVKQRWLVRATSPTLLAVLELGTPSVSLKGRLQPPTRNILVVCLQALSGYLLVRAILQAAGSLLLGARAETEVALSPRGLELTHRQRLMGVPLKERQLWIPLEQLGSVSQETRFQGFRLYAGLAMLGAGTYFGSELFWDGLRVPGLSPTLLGWGLLLVLLGLVLDFAFAKWAVLRHNRVRLNITQRRGRAIALGSLDPALVRVWLEHLVQLRSFQSAPTRAYPAKPQPPEVTSPEIALAPTDG